MSATTLLSTVFATAPAWLVWFGAVVFALMRWKQHPRVSMLVAGAAALSFLASVAFGVTYLLLPRLLGSSGMSYTAYGLVYGVLGFFRAVIEAGAFAMLVFAAYAGRTEYESAS